VKSVYIYIYIYIFIVTYLLKARTVELRKQPLLGTALKQYSFLGKGRKTNSGTTSVARQQILNKKQLNSNRGTVFSVRSMPRCYIRDGFEQRGQCSVESQPVKRRLGGWCETAAAWE
jgi:hypothetical protein